jgi:hypothetical protein
VLASLCRHVTTLSPCDQPTYSSCTLHPTRQGGVAKVIGISKLRTKYESFESKRELCKLYDLFLADDRIIPSLPKLIGELPVTHSGSYALSSFLSLGKGTCRGALFSDMMHSIEHYSGPGVLGHTARLVCQDITVAAPTYHHTTVARAGINHISGCQA